MDFNKIIEIIIICLPVFTMIGIGKYLSFKDVMKEGSRAFLNSLVYKICVPALIIYNVVKQSITSIFNIKLISLNIISLLIVIFIFLIISLIFKLEKKISIGLVLGSYWGNIVYVGIPLSASAFGEEAGITNATIIITFVNPLFIILGILLITILINDKNTNITNTIKNALINPLVLSAVTGIILSLLVDLFFDRNNLPELISAVAKALESIIKMVGSIGLPLALIAVGGALKFEHITKNKFILSLATFSKLIFMPAITMIILQLFYPNINPVQRGVSILLMSMPSAVALYIVYKQFISEDDFMSSFLVITTVASIITIPAWLYFIV